METVTTDRALIEVRGVTKVFFDPKKNVETVALFGIDFAVEANEFLLLLGPSGCGKTTLLNILAGFERPNEGQVLLHGQPIEGPSPNRGVIFQSPNLFPWLSVWENILYGPRARGEDSEDVHARAKWLIQLVGLRGFEHHSPHELSGGMQQRVAVARVLINEPEIVLADEPFAALDEHTRRRLQGEFLRIWEETRKTVVFVTHSIEEVIFLADRVVVMSARPGRVQEIIPISSPRPRDRTSPEFVRHMRQILALIEEETDQPVQAAP